MKVKTDENKIILSYLPLERWLCGTLFLGIGFYVIMEAVQKTAETGIIGAIFGLIFGLLCLVGGYKGGVAAPYEKIVFDRWLKTLSIKKIGLSGIETSAYHSNEIEKLYCETETDPDKERHSTLCLKLKDGRSLIVGSPFGSKAECETIIKTAEEFFKQPGLTESPQPKYL